MRLLHEILTVTTLAIWVDRFYFADIFGDLRIFPFVAFALCSFITGLILVYRQRTSSQFLPLRSHMSFLAAVVSLTFIGGAIVHDVLELRHTATLVFWLMPILGYVTPTLAWRYRLHGQASPRIVDVILVATALVLLYDAWRWYGHSIYGRPTPFAYRFAGDGIYAIACFAGVFLIGTVLMRKLVARNPAVNHHHAAGPVKAD